MEPLELQILEACHEVEQRQGEIVPLLATMLNVAVEEVFYTWAFRRCRQRGEIPNSPWRYFFHGWECDVQNIVDGRFLRLDFGPHGRIDTFSAWGVLQFVMTSRAPWGEYLDLQREFAMRGPPYNQYSGDLLRFGESWDRLEQQGYLEMANPSLVEFQARCTSIGQDGIACIAFPPGTSEETQLDCHVAHRRCLTARAREVFQPRSPYAASRSI